VGSTTFRHDILQLFHISKQVWSHSGDLADGPGRAKQPATLMSPARTKGAVERITELALPWRKAVPQRVERVKLVLCEPGPMPPTGG
jgi:hypothetical protein